jgi:gamma-glutamylcyclotransferase
MRQVIVFAYGSNLDDRQMRSRCASARVEARAVLPSHALTFGGFSRRWGGAVASLLPQRGAGVEGLLYRIIAPDLRELDRHEGCPFAYERSVMVVKDERGRRRRAHVYIQPEDTFEPRLPQLAYFRVLLNAYGRWGFDVERLAAAVGWCRERAERAT